uniref:ribosome maturation factor RimM n=1 Tax=Buchnera aphidicola TaxID=9 RepID=UPI003F5CBDFA
MLSGKIGKAYGILGWLNFFSFTENKKKIFNYFPWFILKNKTWEIIFLNKWKTHNNNFIIQINNIIDRTTASKWTNIHIFIDQSTLPILKKNEYYWNDIIQCKIFNTKKKYLGIVIHLIRTKYNDVLIIKNNLEKKNILIPFVVQKIIKHIDTQKKIIIVEWNEKYDS